MSVFPIGRTMLFLTELTEPQDNALRIVVAEAMAVGTEFSSASPVSNARPIKVTPASRHFTFEWDDYVAYSVRNESFAKFDNDRTDQTETFCERTGSAFLRYLAETTFATSDYPGELRHWELLCLNHCIDVVAIGEPTVRQLT